MSNWKKGLAGLALLLCAAPVASAAEVIIGDGPREAPPEIREEAPVRSGYVWTGDHYEWRHHHYVRAHGHYVRERRGYDWAPGRWERHENRYRWHRGEWHPHR